MSTERKGIFSIANLVYRENPILQEQLKILEEKDLIFFHEFIEFIDDDICQKILDVQLSTSYLSHWKSSIEHLILKMRQEEFQKLIAEKSKQEAIKSEIQEYDKVVVEIKNQIDLIIKSLMTRLNNGLYKIYIREVTNLPVCGAVSSDKENAVDTIFLLMEMTNQEKRCVMAHELGHIIINRFLKEKFKVTFTYTQKETIANLFMYYILWDKSLFYKSKATGYSFNNIDEITNLMETICDTFGKPISKL